MSPNDRPNAVSETAVEAATPNVRRGLIIVDHGSRRPESNEMLEEVVRQFVSRFADDGHGDEQIVEPAHMELAMPDIAEAYGRCVERGAGHIVVVPFFLAPGKHWARDIPSLTNQASARFPGTTYQIAEPLGVDTLILDLLKKRSDARDQPVFEAGSDDPRLAGSKPSNRRVQCATCPFVVEADGTIRINPRSGVTVEELAHRARAGA